MTGETYQIEGAGLGEWVDSGIFAGEMQLAQVEACIRQWLSQLSDRQRRIIERRFGLNGQEICTLEQLAEELDSSRDGVQRLQLEALQGLCRMLRHQGISRAAMLQ